MKTVLHIAGHMGQGIGKVLSGVACYDKGKYNHDIILLGEKIDPQFSDRCLRKGVNIVYTSDTDLIRAAVEDADIVQWDWWHYPLLAKALWETRDIPMRMMIWSHVSGCYFPYINPKLVALPYKFVFTSYYSRENPFWSINDVARMKTCVINSSGGFYNTENVPLNEHDGFNIGYLGTIRFIKLHPRFVDFCYEVSDIPGVKFIMIGKVPEPNCILEDARKLGISHLFEFKGHVPDVSVELANLDIMGYLLNPYSYVTSENAMLEGMSMGIPPICLDQGAEKYLVKNWNTGMLVNDKTSYRLAVSFMYHNPQLRKVYGEAARRHVLENLNIGNTVEKLDRVYDDLMALPKRLNNVREAIGSTPVSWYQSGIPPCGIDAVSPHLYDESKSSVLQWKKHFPNAFYP